MANALEEKLVAMEGDELTQRLIEAHTERHEENWLVNEEWVPATLEGRPR